MTDQQKIAQYIYKLFCERGLPLDIQTTSVESVAGESGVRPDDVLPTLKDMARGGLLRRTQDFEVQPQLIATYESDNPGAEAVVRNLELRSRLEAKISAARRDQKDLLNENDVYDDPVFNEYQRKLIVNNVDYLSRSDGRISLYGQDGFTIVL